MSLANALIRDHAFEINLVIDELEVRFKVEYKVEFTCKKFYFKLISEDTDERLYAYEYTFDEENTDIWNMEDCIKKTHAHLGALVYSKEVNWMN